MDSDSRQVAATLQQLLPGRRLRVVRPGEFATQDVQPGRLTLWLDDAGHIVDLRVDPATPLLVQEA